MVKAIAILRGDSKAAGTVTFEQASESEPTTITYELTGMDANALRGFHIHKFGSVKSCTDAGPHFNPFDKTHGAPDAAVRHVGDLGNVESDAKGIAAGTKQDSLVKLFGVNSVIGRAVVLHEGQDDLGLGGHELSATTGNAGGRACCGVIGLLE